MRLSFLMVKNGQKSGLKIIPWEKTDDVGKRRYHLFVLGKVSGKKRKNRNLKNRKYRRNIGQESGLKIISWEKKKSGNCFLYFWKKGISVRKFGGMGRKEKVFFGRDREKSESVGERCVMFFDLK